MNVHGYGMPKNLFQKPNTLYDQQLGISNVHLLSNMFTKNFSRFFLIGWLIDFNGISTRQGLFYVLRLGNRVHFVFIFTFIYIVVS